MGDAPPNSLKYSNVSFKMKTLEGVRVCYLHNNTSRLRGVCRNFGMGIRTSDKRINYSYRSTPNQTTSWLVHSWNTFGAWAYTNSQDSPRPGLGRGHHFPPYSILFDSPWGKHPNDIFLGTLATLDIHNFFCRFSIKMKSKAKL